MSVISKITKNDYFKSAIAIIIIVALVGGFFVGLRVALNTDNPIRVVESGSMCVPYDGACNGWSHPFDHTIHVGDIIVIQGGDPSTFNLNYPNSDIVVYQNPNDPTGTPIVHRIVERYEVNGTYYFQTKGDGNGIKWPTPVDPDEYDSRVLWNTGQGVSQYQVEGRVVMRIPWLGLVTLFLRTNSWGLPLIIALIILLIVVEFVIPIIREKSPQPSQNQPTSQEPKNPEGSGQGQGSAPSNPDAVGEPPPSGG